uniref:Uncharacterized protein n=1 Tax=Avena sativa TaxID=4498 RepID=A0ACD5XIK3_AVESA
MPAQQKRSPGEGSARRYRGDNDASLAGSPAESDTTPSSSSSSCTTNSGVGGGAPLPRYQSLLADRLSGLDLPPTAHGVDPDPADCPDLPSCELIEALTRSSFPDNELRDALTEYQVQNYLRDETLTTTTDHTQETSAVYSVEDDIPYEEIVKDSKQLKSRRTTPIDEYDKLDDPEEVDEPELKRALYRIKALLLLKGKGIDKLDNAALERKYPRELIVENSYFLGYENHEAFGWYFDSKLCQLAALTDYQRLVIFNHCEDQYQDWSRYRSYYNTPETDRDYLLYWKAIAEKIKWTEDYMYVETSSREWSNIRRKASYQAIRIATDFENIHQDLALVGIDELLWSTRLYVYYLKDLDGVFFEIWKRVIKEENVKDCFKKSLKEVYDLKMFPSRERAMKCEQTIAEQFHMCTVGITKEVPETKARDLIAHQVRHKLAMTRGYDHYARKKLKVAEYIGLIGRTSP